ncbi:uncharacterized protein LOC108741637 [Agrilus planipennis]|uniref:Uncharacterized protein LOC108741637 n=1 Tax=Agrilus planipennis TaxID=224129 RepID=A0A7F5R6J3_AGRPL|nr:uncharacterized protein LOC108741637 [Agrilus planipennis]
MSFQKLDRALSTERSGSTPCDHNAVLGFPTPKSRGDSVECLYLTVHGFPALNRRGILVERLYLERGGPTPFDCNAILGFPTLNLRRGSVERLYLERKEVDQPLVTTVPFLVFQP